MKKSELKRFRKILEEKRDALLVNAENLKAEGMILDQNDLADEMDLASSEGVHVLPERDAHADPVGLALLALQTFEAHGAADLRELEPNYVRPSDAELNFGKKKG